MTQKQFDEEVVVRMTIWLLDDINENNGMFRRFKTIYEAKKRFNEIKEDLFSVLIEFKGYPVFAWDRHQAGAISTTSS